VGSNLAEGMEVFCVSVLCCPVSVEAFATGYSLVQRGPTACLNKDYETLNEEASARFWLSHHKKIRNSYSKLSWSIFGKLPIPMAARSKAYICGRLVSGVAGSKPAESMDLSVVFICCVVLCR
jgi:hypothetical protein